MLMIELITPEQRVYAGNADAVTLPTVTGEITILPHHIPLVTTLAPGMMVVRIGKEEQYFAVSRGVVEVDGAKIRVLSDIADRVDSLDEQAIVEAKNRAEKLVQEKREDVEGFTEATAILDRELARLRSVRRRKSSTRHPPMNP